MDIKSQVQMSADNANQYYDLQSLDAIRQTAKTDEKAALKAAAEQFEAIFMGMIMKSMRQASDVLADDSSPMNSNQVKFYRDMYDKQLTTELVGKQGLGMADLIMQQFGGADGYMPASAIRNDGDINSRGITGNITVNITGNNATAVTPSETLSPEKRAGFVNRDDFVDTLMPLMEKHASKMGLDPKALVAQAALETGWGQHMIHAGANNSHNLFGIKADARWSGDKINVSTLEFDGNTAKPQIAPFRDYQDYEQSIADYVDFVSSQSRYNDAVANAHQPEQYFTALQSAGYATDPQYAQKVLSIYNRLSNDADGQAYGAAE